MDHYLQQRPSTPTAWVKRDYDVSAECLWSVVGFFSSVKNWQETVDDSVTFETEHGIFRRVRMNDGSEFFERLTLFSVPNKTFAYELLEGPVPVENYLAQIWAVAKGRNRSRLTIACWYDTPADVDGAATAQLLRNLFDAGADGVGRLVAGSPARLAA